MDHDLPRLNELFERQDEQAVLSWAVGAFRPDLAVSSSFGAESAVLLHLVTRHWPDIPVLFTDTGFHFRETLEHRDRLVARLGLNLRVLVPEVPHEEFLRTRGRLYERDPDACCAVNKVAPFRKALKDYKAWITGVRRDQAPTRKAMDYVEVSKEGLFKVNPLLRWTSKMFWEYAKQHDLPYHPLWEKGYLSIGCSPETCTRPVAAGEDPRAGRWAGKDKVECGLQTFIREDKA
jgi:phosphoadenosine phosphosulfate reductase